MLPQQSPREQISVANSTPAQTIQLIQGIYYAVAGITVALFIGTLQGPADGPRPANELWLVRIIALVVAVFGVALFVSGWRTGRPFVPAGLGMWVALALLAQSAAGMAFGVLPMTFLLDAVLEFGFVVWWVVTMFARVHRRVGESAMLPP